MNDRGADQLPATVGDGKSSGSGGHWPFLIAGLIVGQGLICAALVAFATADPSFVVEPHYYEKALAWDAGAAEQRAQAALGWRIDLHVSPPEEPPRLRMLSLALADREGRPLAGATVEVEAFHPSDAHHRIRTSLLAVSGAPGRYEAPAPIRRQGLWELHIAIRRGPDVFNSVERLDVREPTGGEVP